MSTSASRAAFIDELLRVNRKLRTIFDAEARKHGLTFARARLALHLAKSDGSTQAELAEILEVEQPTLVRLLDGLEQCGLVERRAVENDRRAKRIFLTPVGCAQADDILAFATCLRDRVLDGISEADLAAATRILSTVGANIAAVASDPDELESGAA